MRRFTFFLIALTTTVGLVALLGPSATRADEESAAYVTDIPSGYRDWRWISSAHEAGSLNSLGAVLGNEVAIKAFRAGKLPFPDGTIIAALHYCYVPSDENNKVFARLNLSFPAPPRTFSLWSRTQQSMPQPADGDSVTSTQATANLAMRRL